MELGMGACDLNIELGVWDGMTDPLGLKDLVWVTISRAEGPWLGESLARWAAWPRAVSPSPVISPADANGSGRVTREWAGFCSSQFRIPEVPDPSPL